MKIYSGNVSLFKSNYGNWDNPTTGETEIVEKFTWITSNHLIVSIITLGPTFTLLKIPDRQGDPRNIIEQYSAKLEELKNNFTTKINGEEVKVNFEAFYNPTVSDLILKCYRAVGVGEKIELKIKISVSFDNSMSIQSTAKSTEKTAIDLVQSFSMNLSNYSENFVQIDQDAKKWFNPDKLIGNEISNFLRIVDKSSGRIVELATNENQLEFSEIQQNNIFNFRNRIFDSMLYPNQKAENNFKIRFKIQVPSHSIIADEKSTNNEILRFPTNEETLDKFPLHDNFRTTINFPYFL